MNNKKLGTEFEKEVCNLLAEQGCWVHFLSPDVRGAQPFDVIAVKNGLSVAIDCKTLHDDARYFPISRLEDNQILAFEKWMQCGNGTPLVFVKYREKIIIISYDVLKEQKKIDVRKIYEDKMLEES